jgi:hypothetical protein
MAAATHLRPRNSREEQKNGDSAEKSIRAVETSDGFCGGAAFDRRK